mgnify:FL=1
MISVEVLCKHMAWANQEIYKAVQKLDSKVLDYYLIDPEWTVKNIMIHIAGASHLYGQRLNGDPFSKFELNNPDSPDVIDELLEHLQRIDAQLVKNSNLDDGEITFMTSKGERSATASSILSQMVFHSAEHRAQIVAALDNHGVRDINLDDYDVWSYIDNTKQGD